MYKYRGNVTSFTGKTAVTTTELYFSTKCVSKNVLEVPMKLYREYKVKRNLEIKLMLVCWLLSCRLNSCGCEGLHLLIIKNHVKFCIAYYWGKIIHIFPRQYGTIHHTRAVKKQSQSYLIATRLTGVLTEFLCIIFLLLLSRKKVYHCLKRINHFISLVNYYGEVWIESAAIKLLHLRNSKSDDTFISEITQNIFSDKAVNELPKRNMKTFSSKQVYSQTEFYTNKCSPFTQWKIVDRPSKVPECTRWFWKIMQQCDLTSTGDSCFD